MFATFATIAAPEPQRAAATRPHVVASFYAALALVAFFWHAAAEGSNDVWRLDPRQGPATLALTPTLGLVFGLAVVAAFRGLETRIAFIPELHREFRAVFGRPTLAELTLLAAASSLGEELLFRGAMLDAWGPLASSAVFALLHIPPRRSLWPWTASSFVIGLALAGLTLATGNLGAAVVAHFVINLANLHYVTRNPPAVALRGPLRPD